MSTSALKKIKSWQFKNRNTWKGPELINCAVHGDSLEPVPKGLEVLGASCMAIRIDGKLTEVMTGMWVVELEDGRHALLNDSLYKGLGLNKS